MPREELDVVDQEDVDALISLLEPLGLASGDRRVELLDEVVQRYVLDLDRASTMALQREVADRCHEVGLAQAGPAVNEKRVVDAPRTLRHRARRRHGQAIARADDEIVEAMAGVDVHWLA